MSLEPRCRIVRHPQLRRTESIVCSGHGHGHCRASSGIDVDMSMSIYLPLWLTRSPVVFETAPSLIHIA
ncbi:hypothetical protein M5D96_006376 [Drosophila gunungcola]|uniref:Uncharacterized protein n=1 Tax=Drosophila gunungcola TaxID=103775 RepID=A0A9P9YPJ9_9MUSC|nr:hypothetical protein M5D96_006376 [Drosophila gunungcola]